MTFAWFMMLLMNPFLLVAGVLLGITWTLCSASTLYRVVRRRRLHREWKQDKPRHLSPTLVPRWDDYDPDEPNVDSKCTCHGRKIPEGEFVMLWPETGALGLFHLSVYCTSVKEAVL